MAFDQGGVWLLELLAVETDKDGADIVDQLVDPSQVEEGSVDDL